MSVVHQNVSFPSAGSTAHGYLVLPPGGRGPGLIVIQEWWGLDDHIADVTQRFAAEGFVALAPDLYGGKVAHTAPEAMELASKFPREQGVELLGGAVDYLLAQPEVAGDSIGAVGFCMGGGFVLLLAAKDPRVAAAIPFYGGFRDTMPDFTKMKAHILGHYGEYDPSIPSETREQVAAAMREESGITPTFNIYPAGHAFFNDQRPESYHRESAELAWGRTLNFLRAQLG